MTCDDLTGWRDTGIVISTVVKVHPEPAREAGSSRPEVTLLIQSDASDALSAKWDDGGFVVDPRQTVRTQGTRVQVQRVKPPGRIDGISIEFSPPYGAVTIEEWQTINGYDPVTRTYSRNGG